MDPFPTAATYPVSPDRQDVSSARTVRSFCTGVVTHSTVSVDSDGGDREFLAITLHLNSVALK